MKIVRTEAVRKELLAMAREWNRAEAWNLGIENAVARQLIVPLDRADLRAAGEKLAPALRVGPEAAMTLLTLSARLGLDGKERAAFLMEYAPHVTLYRAADIRENPYFQRVRLPETDLGAFHAGSTLSPKGEVFLDREPAAVGVHRTDRIGVFDDEVAYPSIFESGRCWMSITPNEIITMADDVARTSGKVLTLGLGLGYYMYMVHLKDDVESITVVERQTEVIDIFREHILPRFDHPEKVHIVQEDAFAFLESLPDGAYDHCFGDIWQNPTDGLDDYLRMKALGNRFRQMSCSYWIEDSFRGYLQGLLATQLQVEFLGEDETPFLKKPGYAFLKAQLKDEAVRSPADVRRLLSELYLRDLLDNL